MFAIVIMKYFIAICTCILLLCSFNSTNKGGIIRECPPEVISSISMLSDDTNSYRQLSTEKRYDAPNVKLSEVNLLCFTLRTPMFTKTSKPLSTIKVLCHYRILLPEQKFNSLYPSINYVKSSCKYFIYTLGEGGNLAASKIRNLECPNYEICLIDYGCGKFNRKIHIMEQYP